MGIGPQAKIGQMESNLIEFDAKLRHAQYSCPRFRFSNSFQLARITMVRSMRSKSSDDRSMHGVPALASLESDHRATNSDGEPFARPLAR